MSVLAVSALPERARARSFCDWQAYLSGGLMLSNGRKGCLRIRLLLLFGTVAVQDDQMPRMRAPVAAREGVSR